MRARTFPLLAAAVLLLLGVPGIARAQAASATGPAPRFSLASWTVREGVPVNTILDVLQTTDGYLWLATYEGLVRFDGVRFTSMSPDASGPEAGNIWRLYEDGRGVLWAGANGGVVRHAAGRLSTLTAEHGLAGGSVRAVLRTADGTLLVGTKGGVLARRGQGFERLPAAPGLDAPTVSALAENAHGLWIGTYEDGLLLFSDGRYTRFTTSDGLPADRVQTLLVDRNGTLWIGTAGSGLARYRDGVLSRVGHEGRDVPLRVQEIVEDRSGTLWIGADNGLFRVRGERVEPVHGPDGPFTLITGLHADAEGSLWISTHRAGLFHLRPASVDAPDLLAGHPSDVVYAIGDDGAGGVWVGARNGLTHLGAGGTEHYTTGPGSLPDHVVRDLLVVAPGEAWMATFGGLTHLRDGRFTTYTTRDGLADDLARVLLRDRDGGLWIGSFNGLSYFKDGRFRVFDEKDGLPDRYVLALHQDRSGAVWISTQTAGLVRYREGRFETPAEVSALAGAPVFQIREDPDGTLWIGSTRGLARLRDGRLARVTQAHGLPSNTIFQVLEDDHGNFWLASNRGMIRVARAELEDAARGARPRVRARLFGQAEGLPAHDVTAVSRSWKAPDGSLWIATPGGVARIDPRRLHVNRRVPPVHVEGLRADGVPVDPGQGALRLPPGTRRLDLDYTALSFVDPAQVRFRYRLEGFDRRWIDAGTQRAVSYTNLPPGRYTFRVVASNEDGIWNTRGDALAFVVRPFFYQTWWFAALVGLALAAAAAAGYRFRVRQIRKSQREAERELSRQRLRQILESSTDCFVAVDSGWVLTYVNAAAERSLGRSREELLGRSCWEACPTIARAPFEEELRISAVQQKPVVFEAPTVSQPERWLEFRAYPTGEGLSISFRDITARKHREEALRDLGRRDALTGLENRRGFLDRAQEQIRAAREGGRGFHVVFIDMDGMKSINDTFGHSAGDLALREAAGLMRKSFREGDALARLGGDEFAALLAGAEPAEVDRVCARLRAAVDTRNRETDQPYALRFSIGTSRFDPAHPTTIEALIDAADRRMYSEKREKGSARLAARSRS